MQLPCVYLYKLRYSVSVLPLSVASIYMYIQYCGTKDPTREFGVRRKFPSEVRSRAPAANDLTEFLACMGKSVDGCENGIFCPHASSRANAE